MRALSTRRRHPLAGLVVLLMGLLVAGGLYSALAPRTATAETADVAAVGVWRPGRPHPRAGLVVLLMGLLVAGGLYSALAPRTATAETADVAAVDEGRQPVPIGGAAWPRKNRAATP